MHQNDSQSAYSINCVQADNMEIKFSSAAGSMTDSGSSRKKSSQPSCDDPLLLKMPNEESVQLQYVAVLISTLSLLMVGLHWGWPGPSLLKLSDPSFPLHLTENELSWIASSASLASIPGPLCGAFVVDRIGRKSTISFLALPFLISWILLHFASSSFYIIIISRFIAGLVIGTTLHVIPMYIGEISSPKIRGRLSNIITVQIFVGVLIVYCLSAYFSIETASLIYAVLPITFFLLMYKMPESPYFSILVNDVVSARESLIALRGEKFNVDQELTRISEGLKNFNCQNSYTSLFLQSTNFKVFCISIGIFTIQQFAGISVSLAYAPSIFKELNAPIPAAISGIILAIVSVVSTVIAGFLVDHLGRKNLLFASSFLSAVPVFLVATFFCLKDVYGIDVGRYALIPTIGLILYPFTYGIGLGPVPYVCVSELFHSDVKTVAMLLVSIYSSVLAFSVVKLYQPVVAVYGVHTVFFFFTFSCLFGSLFVLFWVPETKCKTLEQIQEDLKK